MRGFMVCYHQMHDFLPWFGPNATALERILDAMSEARLNALLVEYETYFPWSGDNARICAADHLTEADVIQLNASATARGIEIIPLVQVLGHTYHILVHPEYADCAEDPNCPQQLCPLSPAAFELSKKLIDDTLRLHPNCRHLHIGGDECELLGHCPKCAEYAKVHGIGKLFAQYMGKIANYVLSRGVTPIMWHDIALNHPDSLDEFDERVLFNFWHYGTASHGSATVHYERLRSRISPSRIIGSPAARAEKYRGALHHSPSSLEENILEINRIIAESGGIGTILTDWPDSGCTFYDSLFALRAQGEATWTGGKSLDEFRASYAQNVFGVNAPQLIDKLDAIAGSTISARGFQFRKSEEHNRYARVPFDFQTIADVIQRGYATTEGALDLYTQVGQLLAARRLRSLVEALLPKCTKNIDEMKWYLLAAELTEFFLTIDIALRKECFVIDAFGTPTPAQIERFESRSYAQEALHKWDDVISKFRRFFQGLTAERTLDNYCRELFPEGLRLGLEDFVANGFNPARQA